MEAKQVKELMEVYASVYTQSQEVISEAECEEEESDEKDTPEMNGKKKGKKGKQEKKEMDEKDEEMKEEVNLFDVILEHLVAEGYADTNKAALAIMANMSGEWKQSIVEKHATFGYNAEDPLDDFEKFVNKGPKTNAQKRKGIELNNKILSKPGMPVKGV